MLLEQFEKLLSRIHGATFASIDTETSPAAGVRKVTTGTSVLLFANPHYVDVVKRRLAKIGKNPDDFVLGDLPWGVRRSGTPLIEHLGFLYLQCIVLKEGESRFLMGSRELSESFASAYTNKGPKTNQGLPEGKEVLVRCYALQNIVAIRLLGEDIRSTPEKPKRRLLRIKSH